MSRLEAVHAQLFDPTLTQKACYDAGSTGFDASLPAANEPPHPAIDPTRHLAFVRRLAARMARNLPAHVCLDDLVGAGTLGLLEAADRFDPTKGDRFEAFAEFRIKGAILDELRRYDLMARNARITVKRLGRTRQELTNRLGRPPEEHEMAEALQLGIEQYRKLEARAGNVHMLSLDALASPDDEAGGRGLQLQATAPSPEEVAGIRESHERLRRAIASLPERQQLILELYFHRDMTLEQIGERVGVTESRVCQIVGEAKGKLRKLLEETATPQGGKRSRTTAKRLARAG